jgi:4-amino-4-deoxy-L-arabinose transferase-like glycosyltransferase
MELKNKQEKLSRKFTKVDVLLIIILVIGILIRIVGIGEMPNALNCDEASSGYEAYSILNYGIDRNGNKLPSFLVSWGGGQNVLLSYFMIPFIKVLGLSALSIRLPMAILGCISLGVLYLLLRRITNKKIAIIGLAFFAICPWHIMKSRWGLESNLFPDLILIFTYLLIKGLEDKNKILYYFAFVIAGISAYSYGTSYYFLPAFLIPLMIVLIRKEKITIKQAIVSIGIVGVVSLPVILYVVINTLGWEQINLPFVTIPKLEVNRYKVLTSIFSSEFLKMSAINFIKGMGVLVLQADGLPWNHLIAFGTTYIFSLVFTIIGIINGFKKKKLLEVKYNYLFNIWFIGSIILMIICEPNINRINIIMIPIIYYTIIGICIVIAKSKKIAITILALYLISFGLFVFKYFTEDCNEYGTFEGNLKEVIEYVDDIENKEIHITNKIQSNYIHVLFYTQYNTREFVETVHYENPKAEFKNVLSFGKYYFEEIKELKPNNVYVMKIEDKDNYNLEEYNVKYFEKYIVVE